MSVRPWDMPAYRLMTKSRIISGAGLMAPDDADICPD